MLWLIWIVLMLLVPLLAGVKVWLEKASEPYWLNTRTTALLQRSPAA
jgi:hypothetical protein